MPCIATHSLSNIDHLSGLRFTPQQDGTVRVQGEGYLPESGCETYAEIDSLLPVEEARALYREARSHGFLTYEENAPAIEAMHVAEARAEDAWLHAAEAPTAESEAECREYDAYRADLEARGWA